MRQPMVLPVVASLFLAGSPCVLGQNANNKAPETAAPQAQQPQKAPSTLGQLIDNLVKVNVGEKGKVQVRAPFVNVDVSDGQHHVKVNAPFAKIDSQQDGNKVHVDAPFAKIDKAEDGKVKVNGVAKVEASGSGTASEVNAPFVHVKTDDKTTKVKAPFTNVEKAK